MTWAPSDPSSSVTASREVINFFLTKKEHISFSKKKHKSLSRRDSPIWAYWLPPTSSWWQFCKTWSSVSSRWFTSDSCCGFKFRMSTIFGAAMTRLFSKKRYLRYVRRLQLIELDFGGRNQQNKRRNVSSICSCNSQNWKNDSRRYLVDRKK